MPRSRAVTVRGALAGAVAASVWAAQQPLDMRLFGVPYDDAELLGSAVTQGRWAGPLGLVLHAANGAAFGALYANLAPRLPLPAWARGPAAGMIEHVATWPSTKYVPRFHPDGGRFPQLWGSGPALAQATWRHLLFGAVLGEVERRLNPPAPAPEPAPDPVAPDPAAVSSNGHGDAAAAAARA